MNKWLLMFALLWTVTAGAQITGVQCGDAVGGVWQNPCPTPPSGTNPTVTAGAIDTTQPTTGVYLDFKWVTTNCSSSIVVYMRDINYAPERYWQGDSAGNDGCGSGYAKNHSVHANYLTPAYTGLTSPNGTHIAPFTSPYHLFYLASQDSGTGAWTTLGAHSFITSDPQSAFGVVSPVPNTAGSSSWGIWLYGAQNVYQGYDLYVVNFAVLGQGAVAGSLIMPYSTIGITRQTLADGSPCISNCTDTQDGTVLNLDVLLLESQQYSNSSSTDYANYNADNTNHRDWSYAGNFRAADGYQALRIRTNCNGHGTQSACGSASPTPAGRYQVSVQFQALSGQDTGSQVGPTITATYIFTVLPTASFTATPPACLATSSCTAVPCITLGSCGGFSYEDFIQTDGVLSCTGSSSNFPSRLGMDYRYTQGDFDNTSYNANTATGLAFAWNYDGGRTFWQMADYAAAHSWSVPAGASNNPITGLPYTSAAAYYQHCSQVAQQAYYDWFAGVGAAGTSWPGGALREWNIFPNGPAMTWWRTGNATAKQTALNLGSWGGTGGSHQGSTIYQYYPITVYDQGRQSGYQVDSLLAAWQINGSISTPDSIQLGRLVDTLLGGIDQTVNYNPYGTGYPSITHPQTFPYGVSWRNYQLGTLQEALIEVYEWQKAESLTPDARIPIAVKSLLDFMWANLWAAGTSGYNAFYYNGVSLPHTSVNVGDNYPELNNLVCGAFAWYYKESGNSTYQMEGDTCWTNAIGPVAISHIYYTGKDVDQIGKWDADYIGYRTVNNYTSSTFPANNTSVSVPDTVPPVPRPIVPCTPMPCTTSTPADTYTAVQPITSLSNTSVTISWSTYKALATAKVDYGTTATYGLSTTGTSTNCASISACNAGCNATVGSGAQAICKLSYWNTVNLSGLSASTTYHFRTNGTDANGNVAVTNVAGHTGDNRDFTFTTAASGGSLTITSTSPLPTGYVSSPYSTTLTATGGTGPYTWSGLGSAGACAGLSLAASTGNITGTPTTSGTCSFTAQVCDTIPTCVTKPLVIPVDAPALAITTTSLPSGTLGLPYDFVPSYVGGNGSNTWGVILGTLPPGITMTSSSSGEINGTPTAPGSWTFTLQVTDSESPPQVAVSVPLTITVYTGTLVGTMIQGAQIQGAQIQ